VKAVALRRKLRWITFTCAVSRLLHQLEDEAAVIGVPLQRMDVLEIAEIFTNWQGFSEARDRASTSQSRPELAGWEDDEDIMDDVDMMGGGGGGRFGGAMGGIGLRSSSGASSGSRSDDEDWRKGGHRSPGNSDASDGGGYSASDVEVSGMGTSHHEEGARRGGTDVHAPRFTPRRGERGGGGSQGRVRGAPLAGLPLIRQLNRLMAALEWEGVVVTRGGEHRMASQRRQLQELSRDVQSVPLVCSSYHAQTPAMRWRVAAGSAETTIPGSMGQGGVGGGTGGGGYGGGYGGGLDVNGGEGVFGMTAARRALGSTLRHIVCGGHVNGGEEYWGNLLASVDDGRLSQDHVGEVAAMLMKEGAQSRSQMRQAVLGSSSAGFGNNGFGSEVGGTGGGLLGSGNLPGLMEETPGEGRYRAGGEGGGGGGDEGGVGGECGDDSWGGVLWSEMFRCAAGPAVAWSVVEQQAVATWRRAQADIKRQASSPAFHKKAQKMLEKLDKRRVSQYPGDTPGDGGGGKERAGSPPTSPSLRSHQPSSPALRAVRLQESSNVDSPMLGGGAGEERVHRAESFRNRKKHQLTHLNLDSPNGGNLGGDDEDDANRKGANPNTRRVREEYSVEECGTVVTKMSFCVAEMSVELNRERLTFADIMKYKQPQAQGQPQQEGGSTLAGQHGHHSHPDNVMLAMTVRPFGIEGAVTRNVLQINTSRTATNPRGGVGGVSGGGPGVGADYDQGNEPGFFNSTAATATSSLATSVVRFVAEDATGVCKVGTMSVVLTPALAPVLHVVAAVIDSSHTIMAARRRHLGVAPASKRRRSHAAERFRHRHRPGSHSRSPSSRKFGAGGYKSPAGGGLERTVGRRAKFKGRRFSQSGRDMHWNKRKGGESGGDGTNDGGDDGGGESSDGDNSDDSIMTDEKDEDGLEGRFGGSATDKVEGKGTRVKRSTSSRPTETQKLRHRRSSSFNEFTKKAGGGRGGKNKGGRGGRKHRAGSKTATSDELGDIADMLANERQGDRKGGRKGESGRSRGRQSMPPQPHLRQSQTTPTGDAEARVETEKHRRHSTESGVTDSPSNAAAKRHTRKHSSSLGGLTDGMKRGLAATDGGRIPRRYSDSSESQSPTGGGGRKGNRGSLKTVGGASLTSTPTTRGGRPPLLESLNSSGSLVQVLGEDDEYVDVEPLDAKASLASLSLSPSVDKSSTDRVSEETRRDERRARRRGVKGGRSPSRGKKDKKRGAGKRAKGDGFASRWRRGGGKKEKSRDAVDNDLEEDGWEGDSLSSSSSLRSDEFDTPRDVDSDGSSDEGGAARTDGWWGRVKGKVATVKGRFTGRRHLNRDRGDNTTDGEERDEDEDDQNSFRGDSSARAGGAPYARPRSPARGGRKEFDANATPWAAGGAAGGSGAGGEGGGGIGLSPVTAGAGRGVRGMQGGVGGGGVSEGRMNGMGRNDRGTRTPVRAVPPGGALWTWMTMAGPSPAAVRMATTFCRRGGARTCICKGRYTPCALCLPPLGWRRRN
jgi:hypothetical protein